MKSSVNKLWKKIGLDKNYLQQANCYQQSRVRGDPLCQNKKHGGQFNHTQHLLGERKNESAFIHPGIQKSINQRQLVESSPSKGGNSQISSIQRLKIISVQESKLESLCEDVQGQGEEVDHQVNRRGMGEGGQCVEGEERVVGRQQGDSGDRYECDNLDNNDRFLINSQTTLNTNQPITKPSRIFSKRPTDSSKNIRPRSKPQKKSSFYSQYITLIHNQNNQLQQQYHLNSNENIQSPEIEVIQCQQMVTVLAKQYDVLKSSDAAMICVRQSLLPMVNSSIRQLKTHFTIHKSYISQQLSHFKSTIFIMVQHMIRQQIQQYVDEIGYLYGENSTLLSKIHAIERQEKQYFNRLNKLSTQQTDLSKIYERVEELSHVETINQQLEQKLVEAQSTINLLQNQLKEKSQHIDKITLQLDKTQERLISLKSKLTTQHSTQKLKLQSNFNSKLKRKSDELLSILQTNKRQYQHLIEKICKLLLPNDLQKIINSTDCTQIYRDSNSLLDALLRVKAQKLRENGHQLLRDKSHSSGLNQTNKNHDGMKQDVIKKTGYFGRSSNNSLHYSPLSLLQSLPKQHTTSRTQPNQQFIPSNHKQINPSSTELNRRIKTQQSPYVEQSTQPEESRMKGSCSAYIGKPSIEEGMLGYHIKSYNDQDSIKETLSRFLNKHSSSVLNLIASDAPPNSPINSMKNLLQKKSCLYSGTDSHSKSFFQQHKRNQNEYKYINPTQQNTEHQQLAFHSKLFRKKQQTNSNKTFLLTTRLTKQKSISPLSQSRPISTKNLTYLPLNKIQSNYLNGPLSQRHSVNNNHYFRAQHDGSYSKKDSKNNNVASFHFTPQKLSNSQSDRKNQQNKTASPIQHSPYSKAYKLITRNQNQNKTIYFKKY